MATRNITVPIQARVDKSSVKMLDQIAKASRPPTTRSKLINQAVSDFLKHYKGPRNE